MCDNNSKGFFFFSSIYTLFIIYGSLVPLDYQPIPFEDALLSFQQIPYLNLGATSRADWISNIVLYVPLTFSLAALLANYAKSPVLYFFGSILILVFSITLAVTVEFYQQFFPPRTVSQNDLIAETMGSVIGLALWIGYGKRLQSLYSHILKGGRNALLASAILYGVGYLVLSFFPYDFVTSFQEIDNKLTQGSDAFFISSSCGGFVFCSTKLLVEIVIALPLGIFLAVLLRRHRKRRTTIILIGFILGLIIELIQFFILSGVAQGISIFTRIFGLVLGEFLYIKVSSAKKPLIAVDIRKYLIYVSIPYILLLAALNGWSFSAQSRAASIADNIDKINWLPFYYHYYTTEAAALTSLLSIFAMYFPIGLGVWLWGYNNKNSTNKIIAGLFAVIVCVVMETGKIFFIGKHPDPTNLIISFASAFITYSLAELIYKWFHQSETINHNHTKEPLATPSQSKPKTPTSPNLHFSNTLEKGMAIIILASLIWKTIGYPGNSLGLTGMLLLYAFVLRKYSQAWLIVIPALLPILDFAPWTGRLFFSEFDYFIVLTFAITLWYGRWGSPFNTIKPAALILFAIYIFLYLVSMLRVFFPLQAIDSNAFSNYYSQYNSLRVAKGLIWTILFLPLLAYNQHSQKDTQKYFTYGILSGLTATVLFAIRERYIFTGLFDFSSDFRITSTFYSMHTGGAPLDEYLLLSIPFICLLYIVSKNVLVRTLFIPLLFSASLYTLLVTYSRGAYIAVVFTFIILLTGLTLCYKNQLVAHWKKALWLPLFFVLAAVVAIPVLKGSFIQHRFDQASQEVDTRSNHWIKTVDMMEPGFFTSLFGMGLGSFPRNYLWNNPANQVPASFVLQHEENHDYLQLNSGRPLYIEQIIDTSISTYSRYKLNLDYRINSINSRLNISICEKAIQHSFNCRGAALKPAEINTSWQHFEHTFDIQNISETNRPVKLILHNSQENNSIDIKNITLSSLEKDNLIKNGDFSRGMNHWFFTADDHIPWRAENLWVQIFFDQGWLGLISFMLFLFYTIFHLYQQLLKQDYYAAIALSSLAGFLVVGVIDSPFDQPIIALLFYLIIFLSFIGTEQQKTVPLKSRYQSRIARRQKYNYQ